MARLRFLTIQFNDATTMRFSFAEQAGNDSARQIALSSFFTDRMVIIQSEGKLNVFPFENVKAVQLSSEAGELEGIEIPPHAILDARELT
ncbi:MAG TPA: hypothetical protein VD867_01560 [Burkholderiales bacterium]|nr:hypothetical protein [Burkholderiales bacterium]